MTKQKANKIMTNNLPNNLKTKKRLGTFQNLLESWLQT